MKNSKNFLHTLYVCMLLNFQSDLTRFTGNIKYPLPSRKATAVKLGKGGNGFVFAIFHNGKEYAVKKVRNCSYACICKCMCSYAIN